MSERPKILVTNDDGIYSKGIILLARALTEVGEVFVVAPDREKSAIAHSLTLHRPLRVEKIKRNFYAVDGTPADCVHLAVNAILPERPGLVVSGINKGGNLGDDITYSGTVSAAFEGTLLGIPSFAVSLVARSHFKFHPAARFAVRVAQAILKNGLPKDTLLNVNVPNLDEERRSSLIGLHSRADGFTMGVPWSRKWIPGGRNTTGSGAASSSLIEEGAPILRPSPKGLFPSPPFIWI